ncbi:MAG: DNA-formamidopyrimidine glycosylase family protein [Bacteroidia bacterium]
MPEGPSILILKEELAGFTGKKITSVSGNAKIDLSRLKGLRILDIKSHGKQFFICFDGFYLRFHLMMFGSYRINEARENMSPRLALKFRGAEINFYSCSVRMAEGDVNDDLDWSTDTLSEEWDPDKAFKAVKRAKAELVCDVLLDQDIFAGVGNIIKNEVLWLVRLHPETLIKHIPDVKLKELIAVSREYCFDFYRWKKKFELRQHWQVYRKPLCPRCKLKVKIEWLGKRNRKSFFCEKCQLLLKRKPAVKPAKKRAKKKSVRFK